MPAKYKPWQATLSSMPTVPYLYLHGADDGCMEAGYAGLASKALREKLGDRAETHVVPDAGHFLQLEQPDAVNRLVASFVGEA